MYTRGEREGGRERGGEGRDKGGTREGENWQKFTKIMQNCAKTSFLNPKETLVSLKKGQNRRFSLWKCAVGGCVWKYPETILSVCMKV